MIITETRRRFLALGLAAVCSPAIVRATNIMPVRAFEWVGPSKTYFVLNGTTWTLPSDFRIPILDMQTIERHCEILRNIRCGLRTDPATV